MPSSGPRLKLSLRSEAFGLRIAVTATCLLDVNVVPRAPWPRGECVLAPIDLLAAFSILKLTYGFCSQCLLGFEVGSC